MRAMQRTTGRTTGRTTEARARATGTDPAGRRRPVRAGTVLAVALALTALLLGAAAPAAAKPPAHVGSVTPVGETDPVAHGGDAADDPAIWVDSRTPSRSTVIGNDKQGALEVYDLSGHRLQRITGAAHWGNVDVRDAVRIGGRTLDLVGASYQGFRFYAVDRATRQLHAASKGSVPTGGGEGLCLYENQGSGAVYAFAITTGGRVRQFLLHDENSDGLLGATQVREFQVGSEAEGCVADDRTGALYVSQEDVALWRYGAAPSAGSTRTRVDSVGSSGHLTADVEGVTLTHTGGGALIVSAQNGADPAHSYFAVYRLDAGNTYRGAFQVTAGSRGDGCQRTDGVAVHGGDLGGAFPAGLFVCQDNNNTAPRAGDQNFKLVRLDDALDL